jgi:hypothetical protein
MNYSREDGLVKPRVSFQITERDRVARAADHSADRELSLRQLYAIYTVATALATANLHGTVIFKVCPIY